MKKEITITNKTGLHARPASLFVKKATEFQSEVSIIVGDKEVNGKSLMSLLSLGLTSGTTFTLETQGTDEAEAMQALENFVLTELS